MIIITNLKSIASKNCLDIHSKLEILTSATTKILKSTLVLKMKLLGKYFFWQKYSNTVLARK